MVKLSYNVIFVYTLLAVDLLINVANSFLYPAQISSLPHKFGGVTEDFAFTIVLVQIFANLCIVFDLILYFFSISDEVKQYASAQAKLLKHNTEHQESILPLPQRQALKLVLDRYWWSLVVSLTYLVLSIEIHLIRLDSSWRTKAKVSDVSENTHESLRMNFQVNTIENESMASSDLKQSIWSDSDGAVNDSNLFPIVVVLVHRLLSTCYYISLVVIYRAQTSQLVNRIFTNSRKLTSTSE